MTSLTYFPLVFEVVFHAAIFVLSHIAPPHCVTRQKMTAWDLGGGGGGLKPPMPEYQVHQLLWTKFSVTPTVFSKDVFFIFSVYFDIRFVMPVTALNSFRNNWDEKLPVKLKLVIRARIAFMQTFLSSEQLTVCWLFWIHFFGLSRYSSESGWYPSIDVSASFWSVIGILI